MRLAVSGISRSGKDSIVNYLVKTRGMKRFSFATKLKEITTDLYGIPGEDYYEANPEERTRIIHNGLTAVDLWIKTARAIRKHDPEFFAKYAPDERDVAINDLRFKVEYNHLVTLGYKFIRVIRPGVVSDRPTDHELDSAYFDATIINDGSLEDLYAKVDLFYRR